MPLPERVAFKLDVYTLACRVLLDRLDNLRLATQADTRLDYDTCLERFDEALERFFMRSSAVDRQHAADQFSTLLRAEVDLFRASSPRVAAIFDDTIAALHHNIGTWQHQAELERLHRQARWLSQRFFAASPWPVTQIRRQQTCALLIEYGAATADDPLAQLAEPFGYRAAPAAYYPCYWDDDRGTERSDVLLVRFSFEHTFALYLAYPFLFLHEYTAHVHATDHGNECFNDGWMLHAAASFLHRAWNSGLEQPGLDLEQANVFYDRLYPRLNPIPRRACRFARDFESWLPDHLRHWFMQISYELAAFQTSDSEQATWPTHFLNRLEHAFTTDRRRLQRALEGSAHCRALLSSLVLS
ncbi:MAG TPA: hypothetical protein VFZ66_21890 [Herpetosiphonaceae bacterium]